MPAKNTTRIRESMRELVESAKNQGPKSRSVELKGQGGEEQVVLMVEWSRKKNKWLGYLSDRRRNVQRYRKRWGIGTKYRDVNRSRGWTTSKSWVVRVMLYGFAMIVNGVWELYRRLLKRGSTELVERVGEMKDVGVRRRWAENKGRLRVMTSFLLEIPHQGGEIM